MGNNINDISAFEKIVFVDNINNEYDAAQLSEDFPFAFILTNETPEGLNNGILYENDHLIDHKETNGIIVENKPSGNIWKGGKRLTKFINIDNERNIVQFDAYDLRLAFDNMSGLLSFFKVPKVQGFKLASLFYKEKDIDSSNNNAYRIKTYANKTKILNDFGDGSNDQCRIAKNEFGISNLADLNNLLNKFYDLQKDENILDSNTYNIWENNENKGFINAIDNKFYIVLRFESDNDSALNTVSADSFMLSQNNDIFEISKNSSFLNKKDDLIKFMGITTSELNDIETLNTDLDNVGKVTYNYRYNADSYGSDGYSPGKYVIYELQLKNLNDEYSLYNFNLKNAANLPQLNIGIDQLFINSLSYRFFIDEKEIDLENEDISAYILPGGKIKCRFEVNPTKISNDYELVVSLSNSNFKFKVNDTELDSISINNIGNDNLGNNNNFIFEIIATDSFDLYTGDTDYLNSVTSTIGLNLKKGGNTVWQNNYTKIRKYVWIDWEYINNPFDCGSEITSGKKIDFNKDRNNRIYCVFSTDINGTIKEKKEITNDVTVTFIFEQGIEGNNADDNNGGLPTTNIPANSSMVIDVPFIFRGNDEAKFYIIYTYKNHQAYTKKIKILPDKIKEIRLKQGITFNDLNNLNAVTNIESGSSVEIKRNISDNTYIVFVYDNCGEINAYKYLYSTLEEFKRDIRIGKANTEHDENGQIKENGTPYVEIKNNKLIYNSDDARKTSNIIELYLSYTDPNFTDYNIHNSNTISLTVEKIVVDWWIYIGDISEVEIDEATGELKNIKYVIPECPTDVEAGKIHQINDLRPKNDEYLNDFQQQQCGILYEYTNIDNPAANNYAYIENTQNPTRERSFGTWIYLGNLDSERDRQYLQQFKLTKDKTSGELIPSDQYGSDVMYGVHDITTDLPAEDFVLFSGNTAYTLVLLPSALKIKDPIVSNAIYPWPSSLNSKIQRDQVSGIYGKGDYVAYIFNITTDTIEINGRIYTYANGLPHTIYYND